MTGTLVPSLLALSLGKVINNKGAHVLRNAPPIQPPHSETALLGIIHERWFRISSLVRFFVSGNLGNVCFFFIERSIFSSLSNFDTVPEFVENYKETVSFFVGYLLQIITQHLLHALLVYGLGTINTREKYFKTLLGQFYAYGLALFGSTTLNLLLIKSGIDKTVAFFSTMIIFACINYYLIGWLVKRALRSSKDEPPVEFNPGMRKTKAIWSMPKRHNTVSGGSTKGQNLSDNVRKTYRGGAFAVGQESTFAFLSPHLIHQQVLEMVKPIDVDKINRQ